MAKRIKTADTEGPRYERVNDILRRVPLSRSWLYEQLAAGNIPRVRAGRAVLVPLGAVDDYLESQAAKVRDGIAAVAGAK